MKYNFFANKIVFYRCYEVVVSVSVFTVSFLQLIYMTHYEPLLNRSPNKYTTLPFN